MAQASQPAPGDSSTADSAADPLDHRLLPLMVQKRLLNLLDARSLASSRCVSRRWLSRVDASSAWVRVAGSLGLATQPREMSRQRVFRMLGGECRVRVREMEVTEQDGGLSESEVILRAVEKSGQLKLLVLDQLRGSARICRLSVVNFDRPVMQQPPSGRQWQIEFSFSGDFVLLPCDELWYALLPVRGVGNSTSPPLKLQHSFIYMCPSKLVLHRCSRCSGHHLLGLASSTGRLNLLTVQPLVTEKQVRDHVQLDTKSTAHLFMDRLVPASGTSDADLVVAVLDCYDEVTVTFVRADCHRLHVLRVVRALVEDGFLEHRWLGGSFFTTEASPGCSRANRRTRLTRHLLDASGLLSSDACDYIVPTHAAGCPFQLAGANATHFFAHGNVQEDGSHHTFLMYRFGRQQPLRKIKMPGSSIDMYLSHTASWACGLDPTKGSNQLFFGTNGDQEFKFRCWEISFR